MAFLAMSQIYLRRRENKAARDFFAKAKAAKPKSEEVVKQIKEMDKYLSKMPG
jgi:Tfp pilus assembly protein PilF